MDLRDAHVLVTGGSRGMGPVIAGALVARGARVSVVARTTEDLEAVAASLGESAIPIVGDVTDGPDRERFLAAAQDSLGPIDVLVNNAGAESIREFARYSEEEVSDLIRLNLDAPIQLCRLVVPSMVQRGRGQVVNIASLAGKAAVPYNSVYAATKAGLIGFTYSLRAELHGTGVGASVVSPGYVTDRGMFSRHARRDARTGPGTTCTSTDVARTVVRAVERDSADLVVSGFLPKLSDVAFAVSPELSAALARRLGAYEPFRKVAATEAGRDG